MQQSSVIDEAIKIAADHLKQYEGYSATAYMEKRPDGSYDQPTIGWGTVQYHNGFDVAMGDTITQEEAQFELEYEVKEKAAAVVAALVRPLSPNQLAAVIIWAYNIGSDAASHSQLIQLINNNAGADQISSFWSNHYLTSGGVYMTGLKNRRLNELALYLSKNSYAAASVLPLIIAAFFIYKLSTNGGF